MGAFGLLHKIKINPVVWVILIILAVCTYLGSIFAEVFFNVLACLICMAAGGFDKKEYKGVLICTLHFDVHYSQIYKKDNKYYLEKGRYLGESFEEIYQELHEISFRNALDRITNTYEWYAEAGYSGPKDDLDEVIDRLNS